MGITKLLALILIVYGIRVLYIKMSRGQEPPQKKASFSSGSHSPKATEKKMEDVSDGEYKEVSS